MKSQNLDQECRDCTFYRRPCAKHVLLHAQTELRKTRAQLRKTTSELKEANRRLGIAHRAGLRGGK